MQWKNSFSVGVEKIDYQHKILIDLINQLLDAIENGNKKQEAFDVIEGLIDYTVFHFGDEEKLMKHYDYPGYKVHEKEHQFFVTQIRDFRVNLRSGKISIFEQINQFLHDWLLDHIMGEDKTLGKFLITRGVK